MVEGADAKQMLPEREGVALLQDVKEREDDWFVLLDVPIRQPSFVAPGRADFSTALLLFLHSLFASSVIQRVFRFFVGSFHG